MNDSETLTYLLSHAPLSHFYVFARPGSTEVLMKYFDANGASWSLMEDDDETVSAAVEFLKRSGVTVFQDYAALLEYERNKQGTV